MMLTVVMLLVLVLCFLTMFGFVRFAEKVIARPQPPSMTSEAVKTAALGAKSA